MSSNITLIRPKELSNRYFSYPIFINDEHVTDLGNNSKQIISVDTEQIDVEAQIMWCGSPTESFDLQEKEELTLPIRGNKFYNLFTPIMGCMLPGLMGVHYLLPDTELIENGLLAITLLMLLFILYTLTLDRTAWIEISEV